MLELFLIILVVVALFGHPRWPYAAWSYRPYGGGIALLVIVLILILLLRRPL